MNLEHLNLAICSTGELYGGVEQFIYTFSNYLKNETKLNFIVILFNKGLLYEKLKEARIKTYIIPSGFKYNIGVIRQIIRLFKEMKINVVHTNGYKANVLCSIAAKMCNAKIIKTEHGKIEPATGYSRFKMQINHRIDRIISRLLIDEIVFVSKDIKGYFGKTYSKLKQCVIYNGVEPIKIAENKNNEIDKRYFNIGIIGRISEVKGHIFLLQAIKQLKHLDKIRLYIFGEGPLEKTCKEYCSANGLSNKVVFCGFKRYVYSYMSKLDLLVMPSLHEGLPYTLLEAMYMKVPVIASEVGGLKELIVNNYTGLLVTPQDAGALAQSIEKVFKDLELRKSLTYNAFLEVSKNYSINVMVKKYLKVYHDLMW